ncbi:hypothetical protein HYT18_00410 [Candidatus Microgenomates bacterium]|nr:hypothetical protein [Candidatus Microgenomates bacterium]
MGVEAIGPAVASGAMAAASVGRGVASVGRGIETGASIAAVGLSRGISAPSVELSSIGALGSIVNEGPVSVGDLNRLPAIGEIIFNPALATAIEPKTPVPTIEPISFSQTRAGANFLIADQRLPRTPNLAVESLLRRRVIEEAEVVAKEAWDSHVITQAENIARGADQSYMISTSPIPSEQIVKENIVEVKERDEEKEDILEEEKEAQELRLKYVEDEEVSQQRRYEIREAIKKAKAEAVLDDVDELEGWRIVKFLPTEHEGDRSQIVKRRGPDGSLDETKEELVSRKFDSEKEAQQVSDAIIAQKVPVKTAKEGKVVGYEDVARVFKYHFVKPRIVHEVVTERIVKKKQTQQLGGQNLMPVITMEETKTESTLEDLNLAEVFQIQKFPG